VIGSSTGRVHVIESVTGHSLDNYPLSLTGPVDMQVCAASDYNRVLCQ